jgi:hypothetical protein
MFERERTKPYVIRYALYLYFPGLIENRALYDMVVKQFENGFLSRSQIKHLVISKNKKKK